MMKKSISWMVFLLLMTAACAQAAPQLTNVTADGESLHAGEGWTVSFETTEGGALAMQLRGTEGETVDLGATQVDAGSGQLVWDGRSARRKRGGGRRLHGRGSAAQLLGRRERRKPAAADHRGNERGGFRRARTRWI